MGAALDRLVAKFAGPADEARDDHGRWTFDSQPMSLFDDNDQLLVTAHAPAESVRSNPKLADGSNFEDGLMADRDPPPNMVGYMIVSKAGGDHGQITQVTVHPDFRRQGVATALAAEAKKQVPDLHHGVILSPDGQKFAKATPLSNLIARYFA